MTFATGRSRTTRQTN
ncbi:hypothetical protein E2C01_094478 [Portunus trituberculatus]|uniref:Uncharacterized protein n=1 Tax=Portunus trituberculatus TaxID=210409 RepID=A0A5B7JX99_PORTR|nr:hypothetical protein [Portunus trituberculatus]